MASDLYGIVLTQICIHKNLQLLFVWLIVTINSTFTLSYNTCERSVRNRNSLICRLCYLKFHPICRNIDYVDSQYKK